MVTDMVSHKEGAGSPAGPSSSPRACRAAPPPGAQALPRATGQEQRDVPALRENVAPNKVPVQIPGLPRPAPRLHAARNYSHCSPG